MNRKLVIDRSKWLHGEGNGSGLLYRMDDGKKCCLGFYLESCGIELDRLSGRGRPDELTGPGPASPKNRAGFWGLLPPQSRQLARMLIG